MTEDKADPKTGEIMPEPERAANGDIVPFAAGTAGDIINFMEDGQFSADIVQAMGDLAAMMTDMASATGCKQKGALTIKIDLATEGGPFTAKASFKVTPPKEIRRPTLLFTTDDNRFTRTQPKQRQFFGVRQVTGGGPTRRI